MPTNVGTSLLPVPLAAEAPDGPGGFLALANRLALLLDPVANVAALPASAFTGQEARVLTTPGASWVYDGAAWQMYGVAQFATTAARTDALAAPLTGWVSRVATENFDRVYKSSSWRPNDSRPLLRPTSVAGGTATVGTDGTVEFSTSVNGTAINVNGVFSTDFDVYEVELEIDSMTAVGTPLFQLRNAGADSSTSYSFQLIKAGAGVLTGPNVSASTSAQMSDAAKLRHAITTKLYGPAKNRITRYRMEAVGDDTTVPELGFVGGTHAVVQSFDGFTILPSTSTQWTGRIRVYGLQGQ